jgi:IS5 family transposase
MLNPETKIPGSNPLFPITSLADTLDQTHPLIIITEKIDWDKLVNFCSKFYNDKIGRPTLSIRLMIGLLLLKYMFDLSDESVVATWRENHYYQAFTGQTSVVDYKPCDSSQLTSFRKRIGEEGAKLIFAESIRVHGPKALETECIVDTTVQEKNITHPTDPKLILKAITFILRIATFLGLKMGRTFKNNIKKLKNIINFGRNNLTDDQKEEAISGLRGIANRLLKKLQKLLPDYTLHLPAVKKKIEILMKAINQKRKDKNKIYSIHEPHVKCIAKGKSNKKFEFGSKVSLIITKTKGLIVGALNFDNNPYDGDTLDPAIKQLEQIYDGYKPQKMVGDRGYRGRSNINGVTIITPYDNKKGLLSKILRPIKKLLARRTAIEPIIGHLKNDHRLSRNYLKGTFGDRINPLYAAAAFNLLKFARLEYSNLLKPPKSLAIRLPQRKNKFTDLPIWRKSGNPLF